MSQGSTFRMYAGHDQVDVATLTADGIVYRCYVWLDRTQWTIESMCMRVQPDGTEVTVFANNVASSTAAALTATVGLTMDSPKIIASGTVFVVHYLYADSVDGSGNRQWELSRATMDMTAFADTWTDQLSTAIHTDALYDVCNIIGSTEFVVARQISATQVRVGRYNDLGWGDTDWVTDENVSMAPTILGVYAHDADNDIVIAYQATGGDANRLFAQRYEGDSGNPSAPVRSLVDFPASWFVQVTMWRTGTRQIAIATEAQTLSNRAAGGAFPNVAWIHHVVMRHLDSSDATRIGNEQWSAHLHLCSRGWTYASGNSNGVTSDSYILASFRGIDEPYEWSQAYLYALNLDEPLWDDYENPDSTTFGARTTHPRAIATMWTDGIPDARSSGWSPGTAGSSVHVGGPTKRMNHLSHAVPALLPGPDAKTRAVATVVFAKLGDVAAVDPMVTPNEVATKEPERAGLCRRLIYLEDPATIWRDSTIGTQPVDNFYGANPRAMLQSVPAGKALVIGGGTPQIYDGARNVELGFLWKPEIITYDFGPDGGLTDNGVYIWYAVYSWTDAAGQTHRSGIQLRPPIAIGPGNTSAQLRIRTMTISAKDHSAHYPGAPSIQIELYRTLSTGGVFFRVFGGSDATVFEPRYTPQNDPTEDWIVINDSVADLDLVDQGRGPYQIDANGVLLEPIPITPPAMSVVAMHANRVWGADACDPSLVWYSDEILPDFGSVFYLAPVYGSSQFFRVGEIGEITAMHAMNSTLIVFTSGAIYSLSATDAGSGLLSCTLETLHTGTGCIEPRSVVEAPQGLFFQSAKGFFLLSRGGELDYLNAGSAAEDEIRLAGNVRRATIHLDRNQLRVACNGRPAEIQTWTLTVDPAAGAGTWTITGLAVPISVVAGAADNAAAIANLLDAEITAQADALQFQVATVSSPGSTVVITLLEDVDLTLVGDGPGAATLAAVVVETIRCRPWTLIYDYNAKQWSRADLVRTNSLSTRLEEVVDAAAWGGLGDSDAHAVLLQGSLLVERGPTDPLLYYDEASGGTRGIPVDVQTSWIHLAGIAAYKRIRSIGVQTIRVNDEAIAVTVEYDRDGSYTGQDLLPDTYSWASPAPSYLRIRPRVQKVAAVRLRIHEAAAVGNVVAGGENLRIVSLTFDVGLKPGLRRVADAQIGT